MNPSPTNALAFAQTFSFRCLFATLALGAALVLSNSARAATILWDTTPSNVNTNDPTQVSTEGALFTAAAVWNINTPVVNGVTFQQWTSATNFTPPAGEAIGQQGSVAGEYGKLVNFGEYLPQSSGSTSPLSFTNLTVGHMYKLQVWVPIWGADWPTQVGSASNGSQNSPTLHLGNGSTVPSQYIFGTFTADSSTQNFYQFGVSSYSLLSAVQLRDISGVPEPSTYALLGVACCVFILRRRYRALAR